MSFSTTGNWQFLSQMYTYKGHRIACSVKVLPKPVTLFEREATNDYHWMTAFRWARVETALWRLFENLAHWQDAKKLRGELLIDHISVRYEAAKKPHPASSSLLAGAELGPEDLSLDMQLQYMTVENTAIVGMNTTKRKLDTSSRSKPKADPPAKLSQSKRKRIDTDDEDDEDWLPASQTSTKIKRRRRTISQAPQGPSSNATSSRQIKTRSMSISERNFTASSVESVAIRQQKKDTSGDGISKKQLKPVEELKKKPAKEALSVEHIDEARFEAWQRLDRMLVITKPPEVPILLLENMGEADVLATFERYRGHFDKLFEKRKNKVQTHSYVNVSHMDIMDILDADIRYQMIKQLAESYSTKSNHTSLVINGLLPLWIVLLFMDTYQLSHDEAVRQIKDQLIWNSYLKAMNDDPLSPDLEG